jgi:hypothetical protein
MEQSAASTPASRPDFRNGARAVTVVDIAEMIGMDERQASERIISKATD